MPRDAQPLSQRRLDLLKPKTTKYRVHDGDNLLVEVRPTGTKAWFARVRVGGKRRDMGLGSYPAVGLAAARELARAAVARARAGGDPIEERAAARAALVTKKAEAGRTFALVAEEYVTKTADGFKHARTAALWRTSLKNYAYPALGKMTVADIDRHAVLRAIQPVWASRPATARKVLRRCAPAHAARGREGAQTGATRDGPGAQDADWPGRLGRAAGPGSRAAGAPR